MFTIKAHDGAARVGVLATPSGSIETPAWLVYTRRGGALNLTPDMLAMLQPQGVQLDVLHFLKQPEPAVLARFPGPGRTFLGLPESGCVVVATGRDPSAYEYTGALRQATDQWASVATHTGGAAVMPSDYMAAVGALQPDVFVALSDDVPCDSKPQRAATSVDRSLAWLRECAHLRATDAGLQQSALFAAIQGGQHLRERERHAAAVAAEPAVAGFCVGGLGTGESPAQRADILRGVVAALPAERPRLVSGLGAPEEVLEAIAQGIDLFDMPYLTEVTAGGYALSFPLSPEEDPAAPAPANSVAGRPVAPAGGAAGSTGSDSGAGGVSSSSSSRASTGADDTKLNLWALAYRTDARPLVPGCGCFACKHHTRAYLHHLLHAHEMLAQVLLEVHNSHHYLRWFEELRRAVAAGRLAAYSEWFLQRRQRAAMGAAGVGPPPGLTARTALS